MTGSPSQIPGKGFPIETTVAQIPHKENVMDQEGMLSFLDDTGMPLWGVILVALGASAATLMADKAKDGFCAASGLPQPNVSLKAGAILGSVVGSILAGRPSKERSE